MVLKISQRRLEKNLIFGQAENFSVPPTLHGMHWLLNNSEMLVNNKRNKIIWQNGNKKDYYKLVISAFLYLMYNLSTRQIFRQ